MQKGQVKEKKQDLRRGLQLVCVCVCVCAWDSRTCALTRRVVSEQETAHTQKRGCGKRCVPAWGLSAPPLPTRACLPVGVMRALLKDFP